MARDGLFAMLCAGAVCAAVPAPPTFAAPGDDRASVIAATLAVQTAMQRAREFLSHNDSKSAVRVLEESGVQEIYAVATHAILSGPAIDRLRAAAALREVVVTDTVPIPDDKRLPKMTVLTTAPLFAEAIQRIHGGDSVGALFQ